VDAAEGIKVYAQVTLPVLKTPLMTHICPLVPETDVRECTAASIAYVTPYLVMIV